MKIRKYLHGTSWVVVSSPNVDDVLKCAMLDAAADKDGHACLNGVGVKDGNEYWLSQGELTWK